MKKLFILAMMAGLLAMLASALTGSAQQGEHGGGSEKIGAIVTGHWEGSPGGNGIVCVAGKYSECQGFAYNSGELMIIVPPGQVAGSSVTVTIADSEAGLLVTAVDQFAGGLCENLPLMGSAFFTPCAHPDFLEGPVKRFNLIINSAAGGPDRKGGADDPGDQRSR